MPTQNVSLTPELAREEQENAAKLAALRDAIDDGDTSGAAQGNVFGRVRRTLKLHAARSH